MRRSSALILVMVALVWAVAVASLYLSVSTLFFNVHGVVDVGGNAEKENVFARVLNARVAIKTPSDTVVFGNITTVTVPEDTLYVSFKPVSSNISGKMRLQLGGKIVLVSKDNGIKYVVDTSCLLSVNETCYRP